MILQIMAVYDTKARAFLNPFFVAHVDVGMRALREAANKPGHQLCDHAADFVIHHLGQWDDSTGVFDRFPSSINMGFCAALKVRDDAQLPLSLLQPGEE